MRICLRGECKLTGEKNSICCLQCNKRFNCNALGRCTEDNIDLVNLKDCGKKIKK